MAKSATRSPIKRVHLRYGYVVAGLLTILLVTQLIQSGRATIAHRGELDLSDAVTGQAVRLKGDWDFYWDRLLRPADFGKDRKPDAYIRVPSTWSSSRIRGERIPAVGDATYRLTIRHPWKGREIGIKLSRIGYAFELYADSTMIASGGSLSEASGGFEGRFAPQSVYFTPNSDRTILTVLVSSRIPYGWSGLTDDIVIGERKTIEAETNGSIIANAFNVSGRILLFVLFLAIFTMTRSRLAIAFSITAFVMTMRNSLSRDMIFLRIFPSVPINTFIRLTIIFSFLTVPFLLLSFEAYLRENKMGEGGRTKGSRQLPMQGARDWVVAAVTALSLIFVAYISLADDSSYLRYFLLFVPVVCFCFVYYSTLVFHDAAKRRIGPAPVGVFVLLSYYTAFEILCQLKIIDQEYIFPMYFLRRLQPLSFLATVKVQQGIISYLNIALLAVYFAYDILRRRFAKPLVNGSTDSVLPAPVDSISKVSHQERERPFSMTDSEASLIEERVERVISNPVILGRPDLDLRGLAELVKTQSYMLSYWLNACKGTTFPAWLNARRIDLVKRLMLENPDRSILDISIEAGYASKSVFNAQFRKIVGQSPSEWRETAGKGKG